MNTKKKGVVVCNEPAKSADYACSTCGGDIRGLECCSIEHCTFYPDTDADTETTVTCAVCQKDVETKDNKVARIQRGWLSPEPSEENIKYERYICTECFLKDVDLCKFFNKIGDNIR